MSVLVSNIFYSLQGESSLAGRPCGFVRLTGCNLRCRFCDTPLSNSDGTPMEIGDVVARVKAMSCNLVEVTGGEPLLQEGTPALLSALADADLEVLLETNGSLDISAVDPRVVRIVDVKTPTSGMAGSFRKENISLLRRGDELKFVLSNRSDFSWASDFLLEHAVPPGVETLFSPVTPGLDPARLAQWILASKISVRLQIQLHKILNLA